MVEQVDSDTLNRYIIVDFGGKEIRTYKNFPLRGLI